MKGESAGKINKALLKYIDGRKCRVDDVVFTMKKDEDGQPIAPIIEIFLTPLF